MEDWLAAGPLSQDEFDQLVRLTARYFYWDVDQFDHWLMSVDEADFYVDFSWDTQFPDRYRPMWPTAKPADRAWAVWRQDDNGNRVEVARYGNARAAAAVVAAYETRAHKQLYWVVDPPPAVAP
ncbi:hypothetical protein BH10ACT8_BH10ACT8_09600 [soil metagenome]